MTALQELRQLKSEFTNLECLNTEDCKFLTQRISKHIHRISDHYKTQNSFFARYIHEVVLQHLQIVDDFIHTIDFHEENEPFIARALKYHFNCIIDSYTFACVSSREVL